MTSQTTLEFIKQLDSLIESNQDVLRGDSPIMCALIESRERLDELLSLVDGAYDVVEIFPATIDTYNSEWKKKWLDKARSHGASGM